MSEENDSHDYIEQANSELHRMYDEPLSVEEYVDHILENPSIASNSAKYLLEAIENSGTRTVIEHGEELERYVFFDDPFNDGEHAILGNTKELNEFVNTLRNIAAGTGKTEKLIWIEGPTATGKSEFKRCLINGLHEYSKTVSGTRYTLEWSEEGVQDMSDPTYGNPNPDTRTWHESPVQTHPLSLFPENVLEDILEDVNDSERYPTTVPELLDPFSKEFFNLATDQSRSRKPEELFESVIDERNVRVTNYIVDVGQGIGVLNSEDIGDVKQKLVGSWMPTQNLWSRGRRNPHAFSYDGVLCQGNGLLTIIEEAANHTDLLSSLLNILDEGEVKIDQQTVLPLDTQFIAISNPDLENYLSQYEGKEGDPLKSLRRRLERHQFNYLTNYSLESKLLKREILGENEFDVEYSDQINVSEPIFINTYDPDSVNAREIAPHGIEAAAMYNVITRLTNKKVGESDFSLLDKALLFDRGEIYQGDEVYTMDDVSFGVEPEDGRQGIPVTYTRDIIAETITEGKTRTGSRAEYDDIILPQDILEAMEQSLSNEPVFSEDEVKEFSERVGYIEEYVFQRQEEDLLKAAMEGLETSDSAIEKYIDEVYEWHETEQLDTDSSSDDTTVDALAMKLFEIEELGMFDDSDYDSEHNPTSDEVIDFRIEHIINTMNQKAWESKQEGFTAGDLDIRSMGVFNRILDHYGWNDIRREFPDFDPSQWDDPPQGTETEQLKEKVINNMIEQEGYTKESAELTSKIIMEEVSYQWD